MLPASLYYGVTTVRDMGSPIARAAGYRDSIQAGVVSGSRVLLGGQCFFPAPTTGGLSSDEEWMPKDTASMQRGLAVLRAFGGRT